MPIIINCLLGLLFIAGMIYSAKTAVKDGKVKCTQSEEINNCLVQKDYAANKIMEEQKK